jgi:chromodomain-helicase-DNA-binding protein 4
LKSLFACILDFVNRYIVDEFRRVSVVRNISTLVNGQNPARELSDKAIHNRQCLACGEVHPVGYCPLKRSGAEHCGLCGLAHYGTARTCPHLSSETQVRLMLDSLKTSTESRESIEAARNYLRGVIGDLVRKKKREKELISG